MRSEEILAKKAPTTSVRVYARYEREDEQIEELRTALKGMVRREPLDIRSDEAKVRVLLRVVFIE